MYSKRLVWFCFLLNNLFGFNCLGQDLFFEKISGREANPVTQIHGIAKDSIGYIWFGSWNGAHRYDGRTFDFFLPQSKEQDFIAQQSDTQYCFRQQIGTLVFNLRQEIRPI